MTLESFILKHLELLELEKEAEVEENRCLQENTSASVLERKGLCLQKLRLRGCSTGLYGRSICTFEPYSLGKSFPSHTISSGDIVGVGKHGSDGRREILSSGVVIRATQNVVVVAFDDNFESLGLDDDQQYLLIKLANEVTYRRIKKALLNLRKYHVGRALKLVSVLFGESSPGDPPSQEKSGINLTFFNSKLVDSQQEAVKFALCQKEIAVIHGPPGTGKTTTMVEIIMQMIKQGSKVLACAPSNVAIDNLVERLVAFKAKVVRLGHPARLMTSIQHCSLDAVMSRSEDCRVIQDLRKEIDTIRGNLRKTKNKDENYKLHCENKSLSHELREREKESLKQILKNADVVLSTISSSSDEGPLKHLPEDHFDVVVIDECSQSLEAACWISLLRAPKCILAGDHLQLPPTIISDKAAKDGLSVTLMERVLKLHGQGIMRLLNVQYRMNKLIMNWPSEQLYDNKLVAHDSVADHLLKDLQYVQKNEDTTIPLLLIDTAGCYLQELDIEDEDSKGNEGEADLVSIHVQNLINSGVKSVDIAVITPYNLQVDLLRLRLFSKYPALEIKSVDGFQGREKEAVVLSLVRSNNKGEIGFLAEDRRINVAITRSRRHLAIICDTETVSHHKFLKSLMHYMTTNGEVRSAEQYREEMDKYGIIRPKYLQSKAAAAKQNKDESKNVSHHYGRQKSNQNIKPKVQVKDKAISEIVADGKTHNLTSKCTDESIKHIEETINKFMEDSTADAYNFPSYLTAYERRTVHELAEKMGLLHVSHGEEAERHIEIQKKRKNSILKPGIEESFDKELFNIDEKAAVNSVKNELAKNDEVKEEEKYIKCKTCNNLVPEMNIILHSLLCEKKQENKATKKSSAKAVKQTKLKSQVSEEKEEDFDTLIAEVVRTDSTCAFTRCKASVKILSQTCQFCNKRLCLSHSLPEIHGCGDLAKAHARSQIRKEKVLYPGSGVPVKHLDPFKREYLHMKLDKKLSEMSKQRKIKKKERN